MREEHIIVTKNLEKNIVTKSGVINLLHGISIKIKSGSRNAIIGVSGSGKTTLLGLLAGFDLPTSGEINILNQDIVNLTEDQRAILRANNIGFIFQNFQLLNHMTALENVMLPLELANTSSAKQKAISILEQVGLHNRLTHFPYQLSGGEQQRVAIARAFSTSPKILLADEPTGNLDESTAQKVIDLIFDLNAKHKTTLIIVTHDQELANRCQYQYNLHHGNLILNKLDSDVV